jgi:biopolymer transport protein TolR
VIKAARIPPGAASTLPDVRQDLTGEFAMGMDVGHSSGALSSPNIVPLIDILLVLIIIFMVITPLTPRGLDTLVPQPSKDPQQNVELENKTVVVQVAENGKLKINNEDTNWDGLGPRMEQIFKDRAEKVAFIKGDNDVLFMDVARAIDIMHSAGIDKVGLITAKLEAGQ